jgi:hypothetical protein
MQKRTRSILQELNNVVHDRDRKHVIRDRAGHVINSAINLLEEIYREYDAETAGDLERRLLNSIRGRDESKFRRGVERIVDEDQ